MIKTMIVDDDVEMLDWLSKILDWEKYGYTLSAVARNGSEALALCSADMPDFIITDITMPGMDGVELINAVQKLKPEIKCVFLTCHEDFNYAVKAVKLQVEDYVLKYALTQDTLADLLNRMRPSLQASSARQDELSLLHRELTTNRLLLEEKFFADIAERMIFLKNDILERAGALKINLPPGPFRIIGTYVDNYENYLEQGVVKENYQFKSCFLNLAKEIVESGQSVKYFAFGTGVFAAFYRDDANDNTIRRKLVEQLEQFHAAVFGNLNVAASSCISSRYTQYGDTGKALEECNLLRDSYFYEGSGLVIHERKSYNDEDSRELLDEFMADFVPALNHADRTVVGQTLDWLYNRLQKRSYAPSSVKRIYKNIKMQIELLALKKGHAADASPMSPDTFDAVKSGLAELTEAFVKASLSIRQPTSRKEICTVLNYIEANIHERITCESMAGMVNMNGSYFSRLFKNETGKNFSDYLIGKRIEKATYLLENTDMRIEEITKAVGLEQPSYFYKLYRKVTGKTPGEVRGEQKVQ